MLKLIRHVLTLILIIGIGYFIITYSGPVKDKFMTLFHLSAGSVKGASTSRANALTGQIKSDINNQVGSLEKQALNIKISDIVQVLSRLQKIPRDINSLENYLTAQITHKQTPPSASSSAR